MSTYTIDCWKSIFIIIIFIMQVHSHGCKSSNVSNTVTGRGFSDISRPRYSLTTFLHCTWIPACFQCRNHFVYWSGTFLIVFGHLMICINKLLYSTMGLTPALVTCTYTWVTFEDCMPYTCAFCVYVWGKWWIHPFGKNLFYNNIEAQIGEILRIC